MSLKEYIKARELKLLYAFNGVTYFENQLGKVISLQQIEKEFYENISTS